MNRDPNNNECTRDPIFLLQIGNRQWTQIPDGLETDGESLWVDHMGSLEDWVRPFVDEHGNLCESDEFWKAAQEKFNNNGWPFSYVDWSRTEAVFLTRQEAEDWAKARDYRFPLWRVYCVPCNGELAAILAAAAQPERTDG